MNSKKMKEKERRRARKLAEQAWEAANDENFDLAEKLIRRAVDTQPDNPMLWNDQGVLLLLRAKETEANRSFRTAISLAPTYAEPFAHLAALRAKVVGPDDLDDLRAAVRLMEKAVHHAPENAEYAERLETYRSLVDCRSESVHESAPATAPPTAINSDGGKWAAKTATLDWKELGAQLIREGCVVVPALLDALTCAEIRRQFGDDAVFAKTVVMDRDEFGKGIYRYFKAPIPAVIDELRGAVYPHVARIVNEWQGLLNEIERFPEEWEQFRLRCQEAGQTTPTPILLKYDAGGFNALHRDLRGSVYFPIQMAVVLSPNRDTQESEAEGFRGGEFLFHDVPEGKKSRKRTIAAGLGDALLFCTRDRLARVGGMYGLQPVKHGVNEITEGTRVVLGVPFHEYR
jgi:uncharacterized protein